MTSSRTSKRYSGGLCRFWIMKIGGKWSDKPVLPGYLSEISKIYIFTFLSHNGGEKSRNTSTPLYLVSRKFLIHKKIFWKWNNCFQPLTKFPPSSKFSVSSNRYAVELWIDSKIKYIFIFSYSFSNNYNFTEVSVL